MRIALHALADELRRLKTAGVKTVPVSEDTLVALRHLVAARAAAAPGSSAPARPAAGRSSAATAPEPTTVREDAPRQSVGAKSPAPAAPIPAVTPAPVAFKAKVDAAPARPALPPAPVFTLPSGDKAARWQFVRERVMGDATCLANVSPGAKPVFGLGSLDAKIMFVSEAPGLEEEVHGEPFVGPAGQLLTRMIQAMGLQRADVYLASILTWRPQLPLVDGREPEGSRPPTEDEVRYSLPYFRAQVEIVNPTVLVALGSNAAQGLLGTNSFKALGDVRGKWHDFAGKPVMVTYHPNYILRNQSNRSKRMIWDDFLKVMERAELPVTEKQRGFFLEK